MGRSIFWIEDDSPVIFAVMEPLIDAGHSVEPIHTVSEAYARIEELRGADAIVLDMIVPLGGAAPMHDKYTGLHLLRFLREHGVRTPVVVLSVVTNDAVLSELPGLGVTEILRKPVSPRVLKAAVDRAAAEPT